VGYPTRPNSQTEQQFVAVALFSVSLALNTIQKKKYLVSQQRQFLIATFAGLRSFNNSKVTDEWLDFRLMTSRKNGLNFRTKLYQGLTT
jgi:hypothetical protein